MRRLAALALILLACAASAQAAPGHKTTVIKQPAPAADKALGLRGALPATTAATSAAAAAGNISAIPAPLAQAWSAPVPQASGADAIQCRSGCAQTYYFCAAGGDEDCPARWAQCAASCTATATAQPYQPAF